MLWILGCFFLGDAILVFWKIEDYDHLLRLVKSVIECSCTIQNKYGTWNAEGLATLRVKIGGPKLYKYLQRLSVIIEYETNITYFTLHYFSFIFNIYLLTKFRLLSV